MMKYLYRIYSCLIAWPLALLATAITGTLVGVIATCGDPDKAPYYIMKCWAKFLCRVFLLSVKVEGCENIEEGKSYVFVANHQGYFDIFLIYGYLGHNFKWMMKEYLRKMPFVGYACAKSNQIYVGDSRASIQHTIDEARETLRNGMSMTIFPEGTRTRTGQMGEFKRGAFMLATEIGFPLVPITINGSFDVFSRNTSWVSRHPLSLTIHKPISKEDCNGKTTKVVMDEVYNTIKSGLK